MTEPTPPTLTELMAQQADLSTQQAEVERQIAKATLPALNAAQAVMARASTGKVADDLVVLQSDLPPNSAAFQQVGNVIDIIRGVASWLPGEAARLEALSADAQASAA